MTREEAIVKAEKPMQAASNDPNAYVIPEELSETTRALIGKTLTAKNGQSFTITNWIGQNFVFSKNGTEDYDCAPVMYVHKIRLNLIVK